MKPKNKVLIIKLGYSETLDKEIGLTTSLGDVLRTTPILHFLRDDDVTWLVDEKAYPLLAGNPLVRRILIFNLETALQLQRERFDTVINLEKGPGVCALSDSVSAWRRFGFRFDAQKGEAQAYDGAEDVLALCLDTDKKKGNEKYWQGVLASILGEATRPVREYVLGYRPRSKVTHDVGFNWVAGPKWPNKTWPKKHWERLEDLLEGHATLAWQRGLADLYEYMDWLNSCRVVVTNDSLGMHLAIALKKKVVALFGPTSSKEIYLYDRGVKLLPRVAYDCIPCLESFCVQKVNCMDFIKPERVRDAVLSLLKSRKK